MHERAAPDRGRKAAAAIGAAALAFLAGAPYTLLDMPGFLDGFAAQFSRFAVPRVADPLWLVYLKHLSPGFGRLWAATGIAGAALLLWRRGTRRAWAPLLAFALVYLYVLSSHAPAFGRYALPLLPPLCLLTAVAAVEMIALLRARATMLSSRTAVGVIWAAVLVLLLARPTMSAIDFLNGLKRADTRTMAADWLRANAPRGSRVAVENSGPTYLSAAGFATVSAQLLFEHDAAWYRQRADYLIVSSADLSRYGDLLSAGPTVFQIAPTPQRWGPPIQIVALGSSPP
jgi:hypothetical protein